MKTDKDKYLLIVAAGHNYLIPLYQVCHVLNSYQFHPPLFSVDWCAGWLPELPSQPWQNISVIDLSLYFQRPKTNESRNAAVLYRHASGPIIALLFERSEEVTIESNKFIRDRRISELFPLDTRGSWAETKFGRAELVDTTWLCREIHSSLQSVEFSGYFQPIKDFFSRITMRFNSSNTTTPKHKDSSGQTELVCATEYGSKPNIVDACNNSNLSHIKENIPIIYTITLFQSIMWSVIAIAWASFYVFMFYIVSTDNLIVTGIPFSSEKFNFLILNLIILFTVFLLISNSFYVWFNYYKISNPHKFPNALSEYDTLQKENRRNMPKQVQKLRLYAFFILLILIVTLFVGKFIDESILSNITNMSILYYVTIPVIIIGTIVYLIRFVKIINEK